MGSEVGRLETAGELKVGFTSLAGGSGALSKMRVTSVTSAGSETVAVCFIPESKSFQVEKNAQFNQYGAVTTGCKSQGGVGVCYWCIK